MEAERSAREYAIWSIIPMVLLYNVLTSLARPQTLVYRICYVYAFVLLLLALYVAVLDANGGKNGVRVFDEELQLPPSLNMNTAPSSFRWVWQQNMRTIVTYTLFIVVETRSVVLNGMIMSFLQLYMGASSKQFSVACFAFMNFWQQIGIMMFLFSGSISYARGRGKFFLFLRCAIYKETQRGWRSEDVLGRPYRGHSRSMFISRPTTTSP